jgi:hypothetical protein
LVFFHLSPVKVNVRELFTSSSTTCLFQSSNPSFAAVRQTTKDIGKTESTGELTPKYGLRVIQKKSALEIITAPQYEKYECIDIHELDDCEEKEILVCNSSKLIKGPWDRSHSFVGVSVLHLVSLPTFMQTLSCAISHLFEQILWYEIPTGIFRGTYVIWRECSLSIASHVEHIGRQRVIEVHSAAVLLCPQSTNCAN